MSKGYSINIKGKKCVTPECRGSYVNILEPKELPHSTTLAWGMQCVFPKSQVVEEWIKELQGVYKQVLVDKFKGDLTKIKEIAELITLKKNFPLRDGDNPEDTASLSNGDQLKGSYFINTHNRFKQPHVLKMNGEPIAPDALTIDEIYSGAWYRVMLEFWYYDTAGNKGISTTIAALMKTKDDESFNGGTSRSEAASAMSEFADETTMTFDGTNENIEDSPFQPSLPAAQRAIIEETKEEDFSFL